MEDRLQQMQNALGAELAQFMDAARARLSATATQEYMKDPGFTQPPFPPRRKKAGPLRTLSGRLARSLTGSRTFTGGGNAHSENVSEISTTKEGVKLRYGTRVPYAHVHEEGFVGWVQIPAHTRTIVQAFGKPLSSKKTVNVSAHTRFMVIPARPYLQPSLDDNTQWVQDELADNMIELATEVIDG